LTFAAPNWPGSGQLGQGLLQRLGRAVRDVEHLQGPGLSDRRHVGQGPDELPEPDHDRVAAGQRRRSVGQR